MREEKTIVHGNPTRETWIERTISNSAAKGEPAPLNDVLSSHTYLQGTFEPSAEDRYLHELAKEYHEKCEAYDRTVCTGPIGLDGILPANGREAGKICRNARLVIGGIMAKAREKFGIPPDLVGKAIQNYRAR